MRCGWLFAAGLALVLDQSWAAGLWLMLAAFSD